MGGDSGIRPASQTRENEREQRFRKKDGGLENKNHRRSDDNGRSRRTLGNFCDPSKAGVLRTRFKEGEEFRKSGRTWLVTKAGMERLYGKEIHEE